MSTVYRSKVFSPGIPNKDNTQDKSTYRGFRGLKYIDLLIYNIYLCNIYS